MTDVRQKTAEYEYAGRIYNLTCNMNVLADVQEEYDGDLMRALRSVTSFKSTLRFLAAMLNDAAETQDLRGEDGKLLRVTARELGRKLTMTQTTDAAQLITKLIMAAMPEREDAEKPKQDSGGNQPKN
jgi:hypothetical protein|nr:MAG TPA: tail tube protein [Caudoviricetes sp.]